MATSSIRWQLSMSQMMKLVVFAAAASVVLVPMTTLVDLGIGTWVSVAVFGFVAVPLTWAILSRLLLRPGVFKDWFFMTMLAVSVGGCFAVANYILAIHFLPVLIRLRMEEIVRKSMLIDMVMLCGIDILLAFGLVFLFRRVVPARCPSCRQRSLLGHGRAARYPGERWRRLRAHCILCHTDFSRRPASWEPIALRETIASH